MRVQARVKSIDVSGALSKAHAAKVAAVTLVTEAARADAEQYVPRLSGDLRRSAETESKPSRGLLVYGSGAVPYARAQYYGLPGKTWPGTVMQWFEVAKAAFGRKWERIAKQEYDRRMKGR